MAQEEVIVEVAGRRFRAVDRHPSGWWIHTNGLDEWWDSPETRFDDDPIPGQHGSFAPDAVLMSSRMFAFTGRHESVSAEWAEREIRTWAAAIAPRLDLGFSVYNAGRWLHLREAKIRGRVRVREITDRICEFQLPIWTHDPRKYTDQDSFKVSATVAPSGGLRFPVVDGSMSFGESGAVSFPGVFRVSNPGTADYFPTFKVSGALGGFTITSENRVIEYAAPVAAGRELVLSPYLGGLAALDGVDSSHNLTQAGWVPVNGEQTRGYFFNAIDPGLGAQLEVTYYPKGVFW